MSVDELCLLVGAMQISTAQVMQRESNSERRFHQHLYTIIVHGNALLNISSDQHKNPAGIEFSIVGPGHDSSRHRIHLVGALQGNLGSLGTRCSFSHVILEHAFG